MFPLAFPNQAVHLSIPFTTGWEETLIDSIGTITKAYATIRVYDRLRMFAIIIGH